MKNNDNNAGFKERLLMEYTQIVEKSEDLRLYLNSYNTGSDMTEEMNAYLQLMGKQMEAMIQYRQCLYERIMMIMDGVIK